MKSKRHPEQPLRRLTGRYDRLLNSWLTVAAILFVVFGFAVCLLDDYPIYVDGLFSMATAGYFDQAAGIDGVLDRLMGKSQQHVPGYFLVLHAWGKLVNWSPLALKLLSVFFGITSLALIYRLGWSLIGREAGIFATVMLASLAYYNIWYLPIRMYTMFVAAALLLLWLYFRALHSRQATRVELVSLCFACVLFVYTHIFSLAMLCAIGVYHVFFVAKTRKWFLMSGAFLVAALAFLPWLRILIQGTAYATGRAEQAINALNSLDLLWAITSLGINASHLFLLTFALAAARAMKRDRPAIALWVILLVTMAFYVIVNYELRVIDFPRTRYAVIVFPLMILVMVKGFEAVPRRKLALLGILVFWLASGLLFQRRVGAGQFVRSYNTLPIHLVERHLRDTFLEGDLLTGWSDGLNLYFESVVYGGVADFYFAKHSVDVAIEHTYELGKSDDDSIGTMLRGKLNGHERVWLVYELDKSERYETLWQDALHSQFERCRTDDDIQNISIALYHRSSCD
ncbi:MAG: glycosyltransferase family 39 protein [Chloroflexi bacterium]|nr:glycosyltransferase family 39 protein [Chloroflexota bacterium]